MDRVRFGRALGTGARAAAKAAVQAAAAAAAPNPAARSARAATAERTGAESVVANAPERSKDSRAAAPTGRQAIAAKTMAKGVREGARRFGREAGEPLVRLSGVLWLEFAGVFFGIFALFALVAATRLRSAWHVTAANGPEHQRLLGALGMLVVFGYFCVSSFVRAGRRARRR